MSKRDTGPAQLPALPKIQPADQQLAAWIRAAAERLEVREGSRGNENERAVTLRELKAFTKEVKEVKEFTENLADALGVPGPGQGGTVADIVAAFQDTIRQLKLYKDLMKSLDDPSRFDDFRKEVRDVLLRSIADEAADRGADIRQMEKKISNSNLSLAMKLNEITAAVHQNAAGVRETAFASAEVNRAQAGKVTQLEASLGNYYQDGTPGRAKLEETMVATADRVDGLSTEYMLKLQAGKAVAGFGLAASEDPNGNTTSAFLVAADKFAIVNPATYTGGLINPSAANIPFGVDGDNIYLRGSVYLDGNMRIKGSSLPTLAAGLRGSITVSAGSGGWSDTTARNKIWQTLGNSGSPPSGNPNGHLVIGDTVTIGSGASTTTRMWNGSAWSNPGLAIDGNLLVNGSVAAGKIDTRGLEIRDAAGNVILSSGVPLNISRINGLGAFATQDKLKANNISTYIEGAAIKTLMANEAWITNANILGDIKSNNYSQNQSGWIIKKDGYAEFNIANIRRRAVVASGIYTPPSGTKFIHLVGGGKGGSTVVNVSTIALPPLSTGVTDANLRSTSEQQPYGVAVWPYDSTVWFPTSGYRTVDIQSYGFATPSVQYSNNGSWTGTNYTVHVNMVATSYLSGAGVNYDCPRLRWVLYRM